ncbi:uncharacterized protein LOC112592575, partial [Melanaphis sacchari]|uniref:uncharacterized protein LOC112592575 n=1 Tax=Melanaphis sacchari TaxID=742174 RepID=UPI000DC14964
MISFLQGNLNHCRVAQDLLTQYMVEQEVDVALLSDPHRVDSGSTMWHSDNGTQRAAILISGNGITVGNIQRDLEFVSVRINGVQVYSCYASPNKTQAEFNNFLQRLEDSVRAVPPGVPVLVTGDFNARSADWGDWVSNQRGGELNDLFQSLELVILNTGSTPTFNRGAGSIVDVTTASSTLARRIGHWRVMTDIYNGSDHHYIQFSMDSNEEGNQPITRTSEPIGWDTSGSINQDLFKTGLLVAEWLDQSRQHIEQDADTEARRLGAKIAAACDFSIPRRRAHRPGKPPVHWWNPEIASLRADCTRAKRCNVRMISRITRLRRNAAADFDNERADAELARAKE